MLLLRRNADRRACPGPAFDVFGSLGRMSGLRECSLTLDEIGAGESGRKSWGVAAIRGGRV